MNWEATGAIGEVIGSLAVLVTLVSDAPGQFC